MKKIVLSLEDAKSVSEFNDRLRRLMGSPRTSTDNVNAWLDFLVFDKAKIVPPPYTIEIVNYDMSNDDVRAYMLEFKTAVDWAVRQFSLETGREIDIHVEIS